MKALESRIYKNLMKVPKGKVTTYKALAESVGMKDGQRAVGRIMNRNPNPVTVPCHRVVRSDKFVGGYAYGTAKKIRLLSKEGVVINNGKIKNWDKFFFDF